MGLLQDKDLLDLPQVYQFTGKPKLFSKKNLPETIRTPTLKKCKCTGKGQQCTHNLCNKAITDANNNIETAEQAGTNPSNRMGSPTNIAKVPVER